MTWRPTVAEERRMAAGAPTEWKSFSLFARLGFFVLALICAAALFGFIAAGSPRAGAILSGLAAIAAAEMFIVGYRFFRAGIDEALWLAGAVSLACGIVWSWNSDVILVAIAAAMLAAGIRLLHPLFITAGVIVFAFWILDVEKHHAASYFCAVVAVIALALLPIRVQRPSVDRTLGALAVVMPAAAYLFGDRNASAFDGRVALALLAYAVAALVVGLRFRLHAPLLALFTTLGCLAYEMRDVSGLSLEARLIVWGGVLLAAAVVIERVLKTPRRGITSRQLKDDKLFELLQLAGTVAITPPVGAHSVHPEQGPQLETGGSSFGGAGAGGDF
ncbi:MAG TPA: hypothetical protein VG323_16350 [Thermoanaerobaculia bacterium]|nr:hypothetical protein [Thermoanaerobaculia bacterium]